MPIALKKSLNQISQTFVGQILILPSKLSSCLLFFLLLNFMVFFPPFNLYYDLSIEQINIIFNIKMWNIIFKVYSKHI